MPEVEHTTELLIVLHVLGRLVQLEGPQAELLDRICSGPAISADELNAAGALKVSDALKKKLSGDESPQLFDAAEQPVEE